jgi:folate-dependent phosphoribosylglycinamide formyltransferase PurN
VLALIIVVVIALAGSGLIAIITRSQRHDRAAAWRGVITDKSRGMTDGANMHHYLTVTSADGSATKVRVDDAFWKTVSEGDSVSKVSGQAPTRG